MNTILLSFTESYQNHVHSFAIVTRYKIVLFIINLVHTPKYLILNLIFHQ